MTTTWSGDPPAHCDLCKAPIKKVFVDGKTAYGPWAHMCRKCHLTQGGLLGTGRGQLYRKDAEGRWVKQEGRSNR